ILQREAYLTVVQLVAEAAQVPPGHTAPPVGVDPFRRQHPFDLRAEVGHRDKSLAHAPPGAGACYTSPTGPLTCDFALPSARTVPGGTTGRTWQQLPPRSSSARP